MTFAQNKYRTIFLSDFHLGSRHCKAGRILKFLRENSSERIYLVGDIIDHASHLNNLPKLHRDVLSELLKKALSGVEIIFIPGNHDAMFRNYFGYYGNLRIEQKYIHQTAQGKLLLVTHGDETDRFGLGRFLAFLILIEHFTPIPLWEVLRIVLHRWIECHTRSYKRRMGQVALGYFGVVCGHIHHPCISGGYHNTGDWVHHCTAIVEDFNGNLKLIQG